MKQIKKATAFLLVVLLLIAAAPETLLQVLAYEAIDPVREGSLTLRYPFADTTFSLYRVAEVSRTVQFTPCDDFANDPVTYDKADAADWRELAQTLASFVAQDQRTPIAQKTTDTSGSITFTSLPTGLYLLMGTATVQNGVRHIPTPTLLMLPQRTEEDTWDYNATVTPKYDEETVTEYLSRSVVKVWENTPVDARPQSVEIQLLCNGEVADTVALSAANDWKHTWTSLDASYTWQVAEKTALSEFTVAVRQEGDTFVVTNTYQIPTTTEPTIPQTGQMWWPVYVLATTGLLLFAFGWIRKCRSTGEKR